MSSGWGGGPWGSGPWAGSGSSLLAAMASDFDIFCFTDLAMEQVLLADNVSTVGNGACFAPNATTQDFEIGSGGAFPTDDARLIIAEPIPQTFTVEWVVKMSDIPNDFTDLVNWHIYFGCYDAAGPLVGLFFSKVGVAYTGSVSFPGDNLQLDATFQVIPGSADYVFEDEYVVIRVAADLTSSHVYVYVTRQSDLPITGQQLRAILPVIPYTAAAATPTDQAIVSVRGTLTRQALISLDSFCVGSDLLIPNLAPVADAGVDQAVRSCTIIQMNGAQSFDPEGASLLYQWRLVEAPSSSEFTVSADDGVTHSALVPNGFTDKFYSNELGVIDSLDELDVGGAGDVLLVRGVAYTIIAKGTDGDGFFVQIGDDILPDNLSTETFKILRQRGVSGATTVSPTFFPDKPGFYKFDLIVFDGSLFSEPSVVLVNVLETPLPRGCVPDLSFIFTYLSDFWNLVEGREKLAVFWSALAQVAATELYTLWQTEYSKSLRDIQRVFVRRWLHFDLLLGEPLPELTKVRALFGGITSSYEDVGGISAFGTTITIHSDTLAEDAILTVRALNPVNAAVLARDLQDQLQARADARFTVQSLEDRASGDLALRIDAPFPFTIQATNCPFFSAGQEGRPPTGAGAGVGSRIYKVDRSLEGLDVREDDFLILDGVAYRVFKVVDEPTDALPFSRVITKEDLPTVPSSTWTLSGWASSELLDFYLGLVSKKDHVDFEVSEVSSTKASVLETNEIVSTTVLGVSETVPSRVAVDMWPLGAAIADASLQVFLARVLRRTYNPVHELVVDVPTLQPLIVNEDETTVLRRNVDYFIETFRGQACLRFVSGQNSGPDVWEAARPPDRLWAEYVYLDNRPNIEANFGIPVGLTLDQLDDLPDNVDYLSAVRGLWYAFFNGPTIRNLRVGTQILLGLPFAEEAGTIEEIRTDFSPTSGRILIRDSEKTEIVRSYRFPRELELEVNPATGARYKVGDTVERFSPLVEGAEVVDYLTDPKWFQGLLNQGIFYEVEKFHKFVVRVDEAAFSLSTLLFVKNFILKIKPNHTFPLFVVTKSVGDTEVSTTDENTKNATLYLYDAPCEGLLGASYMFDEPRAAGGGWRNAYDANVTPLIPNLDPDPVFPTPDAEILWGFDKDQLCPSDGVELILCETFAAPFDIPFDSVFVYDTPITRQLDYHSVSPANVPAPPAGLTLTAVGASTAPFTGTLAQLRLYALGNPGLSPTNYEVVIAIAGVDTVFQAFTAGINTEVIIALAQAVTSGQAIAVRVRPASGVSSRSPVWSLVLAQLTFHDAQVWNFDTTGLPAGEYCLEADA